MIQKSAEYIDFENGFVKQAVEKGCDESFLRGYIKEADEMVETWKLAFDELAEESGDPLYRMKVANDILYLACIRDNMVKQADPNSFANQVQPVFTQGKQAMDWLTQKFKQGGLKPQFGYLKQHPEFLSSVCSMGAGGGLIGLLLGLLTNNPMMGMMLGGLGGAGLGAALGHFNWMNFFQEPDPNVGASKLTQHAPYQATNPAEQEQQQGAEDNHAAQADLANHMPVATPEGANNTLPPSQQPLATNPSETLPEEPETPLAQSPVTQPVSAGQNVASPASNAVESGKDKPALTSLNSVFGLPKPPTTGSPFSHHIFSPPASPIANTPVK